MYTVTLSCLHAMVGKGLMAHALNYKNVEALANSQEYLFPLPA